LKKERKKEASIRRFPLYRRNTLRLCGCVFLC